MKAENTIRKLKSGGTVILAALGDSYTNGWMVNKGYLDFLAEMIQKKYPDSKINMLNRGIPGDTAAGGQARFQDDVLNFKPDIILIQFSLNDAFYGHSPIDFRDQIQDMIDRAKTHAETDIILVTSIHINDSYENDIAKIFYNMLDKISQLNNIPIAKVHEHWKESTKDLDYRDFLLDDEIHPNTDGYRIMAEAIMEVL